MNLEQRVYDLLTEAANKRLGIVSAETMGLVNEGIYRNWQINRYTGRVQRLQGSAKQMQADKDDPRKGGMTGLPRNRTITRENERIVNTAQTLYKHLRKSGKSHEEAAMYMTNKTGKEPNPDWNSDADEEARNDKFKAKGVKAGKEIAQEIKQEVANEQEEPLMKWKNKVLELVIEGNKKSKALGQEAGKDLAIARGIDITTEEGLRKYKKLRAKALKNIVQGHREVYGTRQQEKVSEQQDKTRGNKKVTRKVKSTNKN